MSDARGKERPLGLAGASVLLVSNEIDSLDGDGGIGVVTEALARALVPDAAHVGILYDRPDRVDLRDGRPRFLAARQSLESAGVSIVADKALRSGSTPARRSHEVMRYITRRRPDIVIFADSGGIGYFTALARSTGAAELAQTCVGVIAHGDTEWATALDERPLRSLGGVRLMEMERRAAELADFLVAPSAYIAETMTDRGWQLPATVLQMPNLVAVPRLAKAPARAADGTRIAFFGRLETRKGLWTFCAALDRLAARLAGRTVTFLGRPTMEGGVATDRTIMARAARWPCGVRIIPDYDRKQALDWLCGSGQLAVMPSLGDNSPTTVLECLARGIPFLASDAGGGGELLAEGASAQHLVAPRADKLAERLAQAFDEGLSPAQSRHDLTRGSQDYLTALDGAIRKARSPLAQAKTAAPRRSSRRKTPRRAIVLFVPRGADRADVDAAVALHLRQHGKTVPLTLLMDERANGATRALPGADLRPLSEIADVFHALAANSVDLVAIARIRQRLGPEAFARVDLARAARPDLWCFTGLVAATGPLVPQADDDPAGAPRARRPALGPATAMAGLGVETNVGFAFLTAPALKALLKAGSFGLAETGGLDTPLVHRLHIWLTSKPLEGRCEMLPDLAVEEPRPMAEASQVFPLGRAMRRIGERSRHPSLELAIHLGVDVASRPMREGAYAQTIAHLIDPGQPLADTIAVLRTGGREGLARLAHAAGQPDLAADILAAAVLPAERAMVPLSARIAARARQVCLFERAQSGAGLRRLNLDHPWSFKLLDGQNAIELHPNPLEQGRAALEFADVALGGGSVFTCTVSLPDERASPVRFRVDMLSAAGDLIGEGAIVLKSGQTQAWRIGVARGSGDGRMILSVELADPTGRSENSYAHWCQPTVSVDAAAELRSAAA